METTVSFGYWVRRQRKSLDLTQQGLADQVGCSVAAIKKIEADERRPSRQIAERLADSLGVPVERREIFVECARGLRPVDQLLLAHEPWLSGSPRALPTGTVTFLYTDIEGSTRLAQTHAGELPALLVRHQAILRQAVEAYHGIVVDRVGDLFTAAFNIAANALKAAVEAQRMLDREAWSPAPIKVRMGIHTGEAQLMAGSSQEVSYSGYATLALAQRIMSAAHGGQILLSQVTRDLIWDQLPPDVTLMDMGEHRVKDVMRSIHLYQAAASGLPADFPPLNTLGFLSHNLPTQLTSFIGRRQEIDDLRRLLDTTRMLTLTGPGGAGKSRLSLQLAQDVFKEFAEGVWLVELAPLADASLIPQAVASVFQLQETPSTSIMQALMNYLRDRQLLLILDNCEHLVAGCAKLSTELLQACPRLKVTASSREALGVGGETVYRVPSLSLPDPVSITQEALMESEAGQLFVERARAVQSHFALQDSNAFAISQICNRLDGIPLALELAAARVAVFSPQEIALRLDDRFRLLTGGSRTALEHHQTLRALIDWSHDLLSDQERILFRRLSIFAGGWTFAAAEIVCADLDVLDLLPRLVNKSLVMVDEGVQGTRYHLPETIRQYARDQLFESGEAERMRDRHLEFFMRFAEEAEPKLRSGEQVTWLARLDAEHDNCRAALSGAVKSGRSSEALELAGSLYYFWLLRGYLSEGRKWLEEALALFDRDWSEQPAARGISPPDPDLRRRARALYAATWFQAATLDLKGAKVRLQESLALWRRLGDKWWLAVVLELVGLLTGSEGDLETALARLEEGVSAAREVEDPWPLAVCLVRLGDTLKVQGTDLPLARRFLEEGVAAARLAGDRSVLSEGLRELGSAYYGEGNLAAAAASIKESLAEARIVGSFLHRLMATFELVSISCLQDDPALARRYCDELLALGQETGSGAAFVFVLHAFGVAACFAGEADKGARLLAATEIMLTRIGVNLTGTQDSPLVMVYKQAVQKAQAKLGSTAFEAARAEGQQLTTEQALALATQDEEAPSPPAKDLT